MFSELATNPPRNPTTQLFCHKKLLLPQFPSHCQCLLLASSILLLPRFLSSSAVHHKRQQTMKAGADVNGQVATLSIEKTKAHRTFQNLPIPASRFSKLISPLKSTLPGPFYLRACEMCRCIWVVNGRVNRVHYRWAESTLLAATGSGFPPSPWRPCPHPPPTPSPRRPGQPATSLSTLFSSPLLCEPQIISTPTDFRPIA